MHQKIKFISSTNFTLHEGAQIKEHCHMCYQLYYISTGSPVFVIDGVELRARPDSLFYVPPDATHQMRPLQGETVVFYEFKVQILDPFFVTNLSHISPLIEDPGHLKNMLRYVHQTWKYNSTQNTSNIETILGAVFLGFFLPNLHYEQEKVCRISIQNYNPITQKIVTYIDSNYRADFSLSALSEALNYNGSYLSSIFTKTTGITIVDFLNLYRVRIAACLLAFYSYSVQSAGQFVGFSSAVHFGRTFKKYTGSTPRAFKYVFSNVDRNQIQHLFIDEPVLNGGTYTIEETMQSLRSLGAAVNKFLPEAQRED